MSTLMSQKAYAARCGVSKQYIGKLVRKGVLPLTDGKIDPAVADAILAARREPARQQYRQPPTEQPAEQQSAPPTQRQISAAELPTLLLKTRIKSETEKAKLLEIKAKVESGKFVDVEVVKAAAFKRGRIIRDGMQAIPARIAAIVTAETDYQKNFQTLTEEIDRVLEELSKPIL